jgi:hypothetical protein
MKIYKQYEPKLLTRNLMSFKKFSDHQKESKQDISNLSQLIDRATSKIHSDTGDTSC